MFKIYGGQTSFTQWTKGQKLIMSKLPVGAEVEFYNDPYEDDPLVTEVYEIKDESGKTIRVCDVPNTLLTTTRRIKVCVRSKVRGLYGNVHSIIGQREKYFDVEPAEKPSDYVEDDTGNEGSGDISDEQMKDAVEQYVVENGVPNSEVIALLE